MSQLTRAAVLLPKEIEVKPEQAMELAAAVPVAAQ